MSKPAVLQMGSYPESEEKVLQQHFDLLRYFDAEDTGAFLENCAERIRGVATNGGVGLPREVMDALPNLEVISIYGVGFDAVDIEEAARRKIRVTNTPDVLTTDVADLAVTMMLASVRGLVAADHHVRSGDWQQAAYPLMHRVHGKKVGVLGLGRIGMEVAKRCAAFGMEVAYSARSQKAEAGDWSFIPDPVALADYADVLMVTLVGGESTRHIVDQKVLEAIGSRGLIVNVARASIIDEIAMLDALEDGRLGFAALDVFDGEPHINPRFNALANVLLQPHQGSGTFETRAAMGQLMHDNLVAYFSGKSLLTPVV